MVWSPLSLRCPLLKMRSIGNGPVLRLPKPSQTTSGRVSFVRIPQPPSRIRFFTFSHSCSDQRWHSRESYRHLQQLPRLYREFASHPNYRTISLNPLLAQVDWQPDTLTWLIDGNVVRTLKRSDTINSNGVALYPSTPARIQIRYSSLLLPSR